MQVFEKDNDSVSTKVVGGEGMMAIDSYDSPGSIRSMWRSLSRP